MNDGRITAVDAKYYINGGCTPDESVLVRNNMEESLAGKLGSQIPLPIYY